MMPKLEFHEAANVLPLMKEAELAAFEVDIKAHKQKDGIVLYEDKILDGRNRYLACKALGVKPKIEPEQFKGTLTEAIEYVRTHGRDWKKLSMSQKGMSAARSMGIYRKAAKERQKEHGGTAPGKPKTEHLPSKDGKCLREPTSCAESARDWGCSPATVERAVHVDKDGAKELADAVHTGVIAVSAANLLLNYKKDKQIRLVKAGKEAMVEAARKFRIPRLSTRQKKPSVLIQDTVKRINKIMALVRESEMGVQAQRKMALDRLGTARDWVKGAEPYFEVLTKEESDA